MLICPAILDRHVVAIDVAQLGARLLRTRRDRPRHRATCISSKALGVALVSPAAARY